MDAGLENLIENPDRCFYLSGPINDDLVKKLLPEINNLRLRSNDPITVFIDSLGGDIFCADLIRSVATAPDPRGNRSDLVTVAIGDCASAAADFLAHGTYSIAHKHTTVIYHGTRQGSRQLTYEEATSMATSLQNTNESFAIRLATRCFPRFLYPLTQLDAFDDWRSSGGSIAPIADDLAAKLRRPNYSLVRAAKEKFEAIENMRTHIFKKLKSLKTQPKGVEFQRIILNEIINYKARVHKLEPDWALSDRGLDEVVNDFRMFWDFHVGNHNQEKAGLIESFGPICLTPEEQVERGEVQATKSDDEYRRWLNERCSRKIGHLWYFAVSIARILQTDDFYLSPEESFWLGLVDEVPGSSLVPIHKLAADTSTVSPAIEDDASGANSGAVLS